MNEKHLNKIADELGLSRRQIAATARLLEEGATVPFIARYRKEKTYSLDEVAITAIRDKMDQMEALDNRRESILKSLRDRELLTDELEKKIISTETMTALEDIYLPYRPKRRTRATVAKEKGLEPLATLIFNQEGDTDPIIEAAAFISIEKGVETAEDALAGSRDIIAEWVNEDQEARQRMRVLYAQKGVFRAKVIPGKEEAGIKFRDYFDWDEPVTKAPSHRVLAMRRGEKEGVITNVTAFGAFVDIGVHQDGLVHISQLADRFIKDPNEVIKVHQHVTVKVLDIDLGRKRIALSMKERADQKSGKTGKMTKRPREKDLGKLRRVLSTTPSPKRSGPDRTR